MRVIAEQVCGPLNDAAVADQTGSLFGGEVARVGKAERLHTVRGRSGAGARANTPGP